MKSQDIKIRNLPAMSISPKSVRVKPIGILVAIIIAGIYLIFQGDAMTSFGLVMVMMGLFAIILMPDRTLVQFTPDYLIMYDGRDRESCSMIYWDEIISWSYERRQNSDLLVVTLTDGSTKMAEMYSRRSIARYMNLYAPNKEKKSLRRKEAKINETGR